MVAQCCEAQEEEAGGGPPRWRRIGMALSPRCHLSEAEAASDAGQKHLANQHGGCPSDLVALVADGGAQ